jgi:hypothetical protein
MWRKRYPLNHGDQKKKEKVYEPAAGELLSSLQVLQHCNVAKKGTR